MVLLGWFSEDEYDVFHVYTGCRYRRFNFDTLKVMTQTEVAVEHAQLRRCDSCSNKILWAWAYGPCYQTSSKQEVKNSITQYGLIRKPLS